jgi:hypothetical protein
MIETRGGEISRSECFDPETYVFFILVGIRLCIRKAVFFQAAKDRVVPCVVIVIIVVKVEAQREVVVSGHVELVSRWLISGNVRIGWIEK